MRQRPPILRDIPLSRRGQFNHYPIESMEVHWSFFVPLGSRKFESVTSSIYGAIRQWKEQFQNPHFRFIVRRSRENGVEGVRCWRVA